MLIGPTVRALAGPIVGPTGDLVPPVALAWSVDAASGKAVPNSAAEWTAFIASLGLSGSILAPNGLWRCQEVSGDLADSIGSLTLTAAGAPTYQQTLLGYTRKGVAMAVTSTDAFAAGVGLGPNPTTTSSRWLWFTKMAAPTAGRQIAAAGGAAAATEMTVQVNSTPVVRSKCLGVLVSGLTDPTTATVPLTLLYDRANSLANVYTAAEKIVGTYSGIVTDGPKGIGAGIATTALGAVVGYGVMWSGSAAEFSEADYRTLLQGMGFTIGW